MTGAVSLFPWSLAYGPNAQETTTASVEQTSEEQNNSEADTDCFTAFELIELHSYWFGGDSEPATMASAESDGAATSAERIRPPREQEPAVYRIVRSDHMVASDTGSREGKHEEIQASHDVANAGTLACAEQVLQQLPELPRHSQLRASLSALEAVLLT